MPADEEMPLTISLKWKRVKTRRQTGQAFFSNCWAQTSLHQAGSLVRIWWLRRVQSWIKQSRTSLLTVLQGKGGNFPACLLQHIFFLIYQDNYFTQNYKTKKIVSSLRDKERALRACPVLWNVPTKTQKRPDTHAFLHSTASLEQSAPQILPGV